MKQEVSTRRLFAIGSATLAFLPLLSGCAPTEGEPLNAATAGPFLGEWKGRSESVKADITVKVDAANVYLTWKGLPATNLHSVRIVGQTLVIRFNSGGWAKLTRAGDVLEYQYDGMNSPHVATLVRAT